MLIPIITVLTDVVRLLTFQPGLERQPRFRRPCPEDDLAVAEPVATPIERPAVQPLRPLPQENCLQPITSAGSKTGSGSRLLADIC